MTSSPVFVIYRAYGVDEYGDHYEQDKEFPTEFETRTEAVALKRALRATQPKVKRKVVELS